MLSLSPFPQLFLLMAGVLGLYISKKYLIIERHPDDLYMLCVFNTLSIFSLVFGMLCSYKWVEFLNGYALDGPSFGSTHTVTFGYVMIIMMILNSSALYYQKQNNIPLSLSLLNSIQVLRMMTILIPALYVLRFM